ncbi:hypothetical protein C4J81_04520 [Deltaproteobacteria bacterium Smac51]|nr:hypothetical protein C4J81_04520 [Deltaproteobacteria bacterium Smac51]
MAGFKRSKSSPTLLTETLGRSMGTGFLNFTAQKLRVFEIWPQVVGHDDSARTRPVLLYDGKLTVEVPGPAWLERYRYKKQDWLYRLNAELAEQALVEDIIFKIGEF